jgi:hypothetical protein
MLPPPEFTGMARLLRQRLAEQDELVDMAISALRPIRDRLRRHPKKPIRDETLLHAKRAWERLPAFGSLGRTCDIRDARAPRFHELRAGPTKFSGPDWQHPTDGIVVVLIGASVQGGSFRVSAPILAVLSAHALARRYERGQRSDLSVLADLEVLATSFPRLIETADRFNCPVADGTWTGNVAMAGHYVALNVATFLPETLPALPAGPPRDIETLLASLPRIAFP